MAYRVVGCRQGCSNVWIIEAHKHESATCPQCGKQHAARKLKTLAEAETVDAARNQRGMILAKRQGYAEEFETVLKSE